jgi:hypothetical protein
MTSSIVKSIKASIIGSVIQSNSGVTRNFIELELALSSHYLLNSTFSPTAGCILECSIAIIPLINNGIFGHVSLSNSYMRINPAGSIRVVSNSGSSYEVMTGAGDGILHEIKFVGTLTTGELFVDDISLGVLPGDFSSFDIGVIGDYLGIPTPRFFNGIMSNPRFTDTGAATTTTFKLDQATGNSEASVEANNTLTYVNIPESNRELFQLSEDETQWDNISPPVQVLPAVMVIA